MTTYVSVHDVDTVTVERQSASGADWTTFTARNRYGEEVELTVFHDGDLTIENNSE